MSLADIDLLDQAHYISNGPPHDLFRRLRARRSGALASGAGRPGVLGGDALRRRGARVARLGDLLVGARRHDDSRGAARGALAVLPSDDAQHGPAAAHQAARCWSTRASRRAWWHSSTAASASWRATIVERVVPRGECDFVADVAGELPSYVIAELVGIPLDDGRQLYRLTERMHTAAPTPEGRADVDGRRRSR